MKLTKFGIVSSALSLLVVICTFAFNFVNLSAIDKGVSAWNLFSGGDAVAETIRDNSSGGFLILVAVLLLVANIAVQLKVPAFAKLANTVTSIACVVIYAFAAIKLLGSDKLESAKPGLAFGAYLILAASAAMFFVPKMVSKK